MIYLATPYSHPDTAIREERFRMACAASARLMAAGFAVFCPIAHSHPLALAGSLPLDWDFWEHYDRWFIERCDVLVVVMLPGWEDSRGIAAEVALAQGAGREVVYVGFGTEVEDLALARGGGGVMPTMPREHPRH